jgi:hypothetical protein
MEMPADNQLVPYHAGQNQVIPYRPPSAPQLSLSGESAARRYALLRPPLFSGPENQPDLAESAYNSDRLLVIPKLNQVGLLIDIYA